MIKFIFYFFSFLVILLGLFKSSEWWLIILPFCFILSGVIFPKIYTLAKGRIIYLIYLVVAFIRYSITPFLFIVSSGYYENYLLKDTSEPFLAIASLFMVFELFFCMFLIQLFANNNLNKMKFDRYKLTNNYFLYFVCFLIFLIFLIFPDLKLRYNFIFIPEELIKPELEVVGAGFLSILADYILILPPLLIFNYFVNKYYKIQSYKYILFLLISFIPFLLFFKGVSRFSALLPALAWLSTFCLVLPKYKKVATFTIMGSAFIVLISVSLFKQFGYSSANKSNDIGINWGEMAVVFNAYFSGVYNVAYVMDIDKFINLNSGMHLFFNDFLKNIAMLSGFADNTSTSGFYFNNYIYSQSGQADQIIPIVGQSYLYFGYSGFFIMPAICVLIMIFLEKKIYSIDKLNYIFPLTLLSIYFSLAMMISLNSIYPAMFNFVLPLLLILKINEFISKVRAK